MEWAQDLPSGQQREKVVITARRPADRYSPDVLVAALNGAPEGSLWFWSWMMPVRVPVSCRAWLGWCGCRCAGVAGSGRLALGDRRHELLGGPRAAARSWCGAARRWST